jgi:hypothetical protein
MFSSPVIKDLIHGQNTENCFLKRLIDGSRHFISLPFSHSLQWDNFKMKAVESSYIGKPWKCKIQKRISRGQFMITDGEFKSHCRRIIVRLTFRMCWPVYLWRSYSEYMVRYLCSINLGRHGICTKFHWVTLAPFTLSVWDNKIYVSHFSGL